MACSLEFYGDGISFWVVFSQSFKLWSPFWWCKSQGDGPYLRNNQWGLRWPQWLRLHASNAGDAGSIPGQGTKVLHATQCSQKKKKKQAGTLGESQGAKAEDCCVSKVKT